VTGAVQHHCDIQTHSISSLLDTITHLTPGTQPRQEPRQPDSATYRQPGNPATRQHPAARWKCPHIVSAWQHPAVTRQHPAEPGTRQHPATRQTPGNTPATRQPDPATPGNPATRAQVCLSILLIYISHYEAGKVQIRAIRYTTTVVLTLATLARPPATTARATHESRGLADGRAPPRAAARSANARRSTRPQRETRPPETRRVRRWPWPMLQALTLPVYVVSVVAALYEGASAQVSLAQHCATHAHSHHRH
jgi:hypothetical protein